MHLCKYHGKPASKLKYSRIIGSLMYITNFIRLDIACAINKLSQFTSNPSEVHLKDLTRVFKYLRHTLEYELHIRDIMWYYKDIVIIIEFLTPKTTNPIVAIFLALMVGRSLGGHQNKSTLLDP